MVCVGGCGGTKWIAASRLEVSQSGYRHFGLKPPASVQGNIFDPDAWRVRVLMLLALAIDQSIDVVENPGRMMAIANGLAAAGQPLVVEMLNRGQDRPIWNLSTALEELLS